MTEECIFCHADESSVVYRGDDGIVIVDDPIRDGHLMVGVATHVTNLHDVAPTEAAAMFALAARVSAVVVEATGVEKTYVAAIGDMDKHFHVHLLPKAVDDPNLGPFVFSGNGWAGFLPPTPDMEATERVIDSVRSSLS